MAASLTFELQQFEKGYFLAWEVLTQCMNTVTVTMKVGKTTYINASKSNHSTELQKIAFDTKDLKDDGVPILTVTVNEATTLKESHSTGAITDNKARQVGYVYDFCIEDQNDDDYNDVYINIIGWLKKG